MADARTRGIIQSLKDGWLWMSQGFIVIAGLILFYDIGGLVGWWVVFGIGALLFITGLIEIVTAVDDYRHPDEPRDDNDRD